MARDYISGIESIDRSLIGLSDVRPPGELMLVAKARGWFVCVAVVTALTSGLPRTAFAQTEDNPPAPAAETSIVATGLAQAAAAFVQNAPSPALPEHTGFHALFKASISDFKAFPRRTSTWVILGIGGAGALAAHPVDDVVNQHLVSDSSGRFFAAGKWLGNPYVVTASAVGVWAIGRYVETHPKGEPKTNKLAHIGFDLMRVQILSQALVQGLKYSVQRDRPTGECCAFPSGHAASAFATASVLERHFGYRNSWPALVAASYVAASRLHDNRHFLSDVIFGAAVGTASGWTVVGHHGRDNYALTPVPVRGGLAVMFTRTVEP
jgi:hypothetical protein